MSDLPTIFEFVYQPEARHCLAPWFQPPLRYGKVECDIDDSIVDANKLPGPVNSWLLKISVPGDHSRAIALGDVGVRVL